MNTANPVLDTSKFIPFAKTQMGDFQTPKTLAWEFKTQTNQTGPTNYPNFWQIGCVFDTILDYFLALKEAGELGDSDKTLMKQLMSQAVKGYQYGIVGLTAAWYDDWSWWGIAASKSFDENYEDIFGDQLEFFQTTALDTWGVVDAGSYAPVANSIPDSVWARSKTMDDGQKFTREILSNRSQIHIGTPNAWALILRGENGKGTDCQNADYKYFNTPEGDQWAVPRIPGGCWQYDLSTSQFPANDGPDWENPNPNAQPLGVFQVTLMSALYLSFACSLMTAAKCKAAETKSGNTWDHLNSYDNYQKSAENVFSFLTNWFEVEGDDSLVKVLSAGSMVHERTPTYAEAPGIGFPAVQKYCPDTYWGGDQGLIMGALKQYGHLVGAQPPEMLNESTEPIFARYPMAILIGVFYNMPATELGLANAVGPYLNPDNSPLSGDLDDYKSGSGIFWRYVMRTCRLDSNFKAKASSDAKIVSIAETSGTHDNNWGNDLFIPFNTVAAAIGAWYLLK